MDSLPPTYDQLLSMSGQLLGVSDWTLIDQGRINAFAECTGDRQWIHTDPERARRQSPFRSTIAHGKLILALVSALGQDMNAIPENTQGVINQGLDNVRFLAAVPVNARVRLRSTLMTFFPEGPGKYLARVFNAVEMEGRNEPVLTCESVSVFYERRNRRPAGEG